MPLVLRTTVRLPVTSQRLRRIVHEPVVFYYHNGGQPMTRHKTTTVKLNLEEIELLHWALYRLNRASLDQRQLENLERIDDRLSRAEDRVL